MASIDEIINRQFRLWEQSQQERRDASPQEPEIPQIVTVSREYGSRGSYFATRLAEILGYQVLHRGIIDAICKSSGYRKRIIESLDEKYRNDAEVFVQAIITGQAVDHTDYFKNLCRVVYSMAQLGGVVLVGRGGNFILGPDVGFHMRVVAPREKRIVNLVKYKRIDQDDAAREIDKIDQEREALIRKYFGCDINDPQYYDLVFNSAYLDVEDAVGFAIEAIAAKMDKMIHEKAR